VKVKLLKIYSQVNLSVIIMILLIVIGLNLPVKAIVDLWYPLNFYLFYILPILLLPYFLLNLFIYLTNKQKVFLVRFILSFFWFIICYFIFWYSSLPVL